MPRLFRLCSVASSARSGVVTGKAPGAAQHRVFCWLRYAVNQFNGLFLYRLAFDFGRDGQLDADDGALTGARGYGERAPEQAHPVAQAG